MGMAGATAEVVVGGNRRVEVRVPVAIDDRHGNVWWTGEAVTFLDIPAGMKLPDVRVMNIPPSAREVSRGE